MKNRLLIAASILLISACGKDDGAVKAVRPVKVIEVGKNSADKSIDFSGIVAPSKETVLGFKVAGPVAVMNLTQGQKVKKDEVIAELDTRDYKINLEVYKKKYEAAKAAADNAVFQYNRAEKLYRADAMTKKNFDMITAQKKAAVSMLKEAEQGVAAATNKLSDTQLKAPYDGYISKKFADAGSVVNAGTPVAAITAEGLPEVNISIAGKDIPLLENAKEFFFVPNDAPDKRYSLTLKEIGKNPEFAKITYPAVFEIKDGDDIRIGSSGKVTAKIDSNENRDIVIPVTALFEDNGSRVYIYADGVVQSREVEIGNLYPDGQITIIKGLNPEDKVITSGINSITEGEKVKLLPEPSKTNIGNVL